MAAITIVGVSLWYTNTLVNKIAREERKKVKLWAAAIERKVELVRYTNVLFDKIKTEERKKVELWAEATRQLSLDLPDYGFVLKVVAEPRGRHVQLAVAGVVKSGKHDGFRCHCSKELGGSNPSARTGSVSSASVGTCERRTDQRQVGTPIRSAGSNPGTGMGRPGPRTCRRGA